MKFRCFYFEGYFSDDATENAGFGVFSECLVQSNNENDAEFKFLEALSEQKINLIEIEESFPVDNSPEEMNSENEDNLYWIEWCEEAELTGKAVFQTFNLYPADEVIKPAQKAN